METSKVAIHADFGMLNMPPVMDRESGAGGYIVGWWQVKQGGVYAVSLLNPKGKTAAFCIAHQRLFGVLEKCPECTSKIETTT